MIQIYFLILNGDKMSNNNNYKHGMSYTKIYARWRGMMSRCYKKNMKFFNRYGGRGIKVCKRWHNFENFYVDMGNPPFEGAQLDRYPNNDGDYELGNCRWATSKENNNNRHNSKQEKFRTSIHYKNKYQSYIIVNKKNFYIGLFKTQKEAIEAGKIMQKEWFGEI